MKPILLLLALSLTQCTHTPPTAKKGGEVNILFAMNRHGELEPCGCSIFPMGGVEREWNAVRAWKKKTPALYLSGGTHFTPVTEDFKKRSIPSYREKAGYLVDALNQLEVTAIAPTAEDFVLGTNALQKLVKRSRFPWISTNIVDKKTKNAIFNRALEVNVSGTSVLLVGISHHVNEKYPKPSDIEIVPAEKALSDLFATTPSEGRLVILISNLPEEERLALSKQFPQIDIFLGGLGSPTLYGAEAMTAKTLYLNPLPRTKNLGYLAVTPRFPNGGFYRAKSAEHFKELLDLWKRNISDIEQRLATATPAQATTLRKEQTEYLNYVERFRDLPMKATNETSNFESNVIELNASLSNPPNPMSKLVSGYKNHVRELALKE